MRSALPTRTESRYLCAAYKMPQEGQGSKRSLPKAINNKILRMETFESIHYDEQSTFLPRRRQHYRRDSRLTLEGVSDGSVGRAVAEPDLFFKLLFLSCLAASLSGLYWSGGGTHARTRKMEVGRKGDPLSASMVVASSHRRVADLVERSGATAKFKVIPRNEASRF